MKKTGKMLYLPMISNVVAEALHKMINILTKIDEFDIEPVADPGFSPGGGAPTPKIAIIFHIFAENCMKMKEFGPPGGGGRASLAPPLGSANVNC